LRGTKGAEIKMMNVSKNKCVGCGICKSDCPVGSISVDVKRGIAVFDIDKCIYCELCIQNCPQGAIRDIVEELTIAIGTDNEKIIKPDDHIGMSEYFQVWKYSNGELIFKETRENVKYVEDEARIHGDPKKAEATTSVLKDIDVLVGKMMGPNIKRLKNKFVTVIIREPEIEKSLKIIRENINEIVEEKEKTERRGLILQ